MTADYILTTKRCRLRRPTPDDMSHAFSASRVPGFNDGMTWDPPGHIDELRLPFEAAANAWDAGEAYSFTIETIESREPIGRVSIRKQQEAGLWDLGFWTHPAQQGRGFMTEAVGAVLEFGFQKLGATRIQARHALWNKASRRVMEKNGMKYDRYVEKGFLKNGTWVGEDQLAIGRDEWMNLAPTRVAAKDVPRQ